MPDAKQAQQALRDPVFYTLPVEERTKVLARLDPNFSTLPPDEQVKVVSRGVPQAAPPTLPSTSRDATAGASQATGLRSNNEGWADQLMDWVNQKTRDLRPGTDLAGVNDPAIQSRQEMAAKTLAGPVLGPAEFAAGTLRNLGSKSEGDTRSYLHRRLQGETEQLTGAMNAPGAAGMLSPRAAPALVAGGLTSAATSPLVRALPISDEAKDLTNTVIPALGGAVGAAGEGRLGRAADALHPTPDIPPGLSDDATANLGSKTARLGTQDVFRAAAPPAGNPGFRERLSIAAPDLAEMQRRTPLQTSGGFINPDYRIREFTTNANNYLSDLWNNERMPQIQRNASAVRSLDPIKQSILGSVSDLDRENYPGAAQEINRKVASMPETETLSQLNDRLREVNAQRNAYRGMTPQEQAAANITAPRIDALNSEYRALQQVIGDELANRGEAGVTDFDRRYGALSEVRDAVQDQMNPAEATRLLDQVKAWISPTGAAGIHQRIPMIASPGRTLESGLQRLARSPLQTPQTMPPTPPTIAGQLPAPKPILAAPPDTSGPIPLADRTDPTVWTPEMRDRLARETPATTPPVPSQYRVESTLAPDDRALGAAGTAGIRTTPFALLPAPPKTMPAIPVPQVGQLPAAGFPPTMPDPMWQPRLTPFAPTWENPDPTQPATTPSGVAVRRRVPIPPAPQQ